MDEARRICEQHRQGADAVIGKAVTLEEAPLRKLIAYNLAKTAHATITLRKAYPPEEVSR